MREKKEEEKHEGFKAYKMYLGFKLHFTSERYDYLKAKGRVRYNKTAFAKRQDSHFFVKIARVYNTHELKGLFISHFVSDSQFNDLYSEDAKDTFVGWKKRIQSMTYNFEKELDVLLERVENFDDLFKVEDGNVPIVVRALYHNDISVETFIILDSVLGFVEHIDKKIDDDIIWPRWKTRCSKYSRLLDVDVDKYKNLLKKRLF